MTQFKTQPEEIASWLRSEFADAEVRVVEIDSHFAYLYRVYNRERSPFPELVIPWKVLEDWTGAEITTALRDRMVVEAMRRNPEKRFRYTTLGKLEIDQA